MSWSPVKGFSFFCFLFRNQRSLLLNIQRLLIVSWLQSFLLLKTTLTLRPSPFIGPDSTPNSSASIKFFLYSSFSMFLNADPNSKPYYFPQNDSSQKSSYSATMLVYASCRWSSQQLWQSLLSRAVHRHEASRQPCVNFFPLISSVGFVVFLFSRWITQSVFLIPSDWPPGTMWNINVIFKRSRLKTITDMELKWLTLLKSDSLLKRMIKCSTSNC